MVLHGIHPRVLKNLVEVLTKILPIIYQQSWLIKDVSVDWMLANVHKKGRKKDLLKYGPESDLSSRKGHEGDHPEYQHTVCTG